MHHRVILRLRERGTNWIFTTDGRIGGRCGLSIIQVLGEFSEQIAYLLVWEYNCQICMWYNYKLAKKRPKLPSSNRRFRSMYVHFNLAEWLRGAIATFRISFFPMATIIMSARWPRARLRNLDRKFTPIFPFNISQIRCQRQRTIFGAHKSQSQEGGGGRFDGHGTGRWRSGDW